MREPTTALPLSDLLAYAVRSMRRDFHARARGLNVTPALARLLFYVARDPGSSQAELAARLEVTPATLGRMVDRLAARGYVRRDADATDRRAFRVYVDHAGEPLLRRMDDIRTLTEARAMSGVPQEDRDRLASVLERICQNLSDHAP